jgi:RHH-type rel operon transcriptional repressor/antitoxin RelB
MNIMKYRGYTARIEFDDRDSIFVDQCNTLSYNVLHWSTLGGIPMLKTANLTVRIKPDTRNRIETLARVTRRSKSYVIEEALEQYLDVNEWQIKGIQEALTEADSQGAVFVDHEEVLAQREAKLAG